MDYIFDLIKYAMLTEIGSGRKAAPGWAYVVSACLALYGWRGGATDALENKESSERSPEAVEF